jgi:cell division protein FtsL
VSPADPGWRDRAAGAIEETVGEELLQGAEPSRRDDQQQQERHLRLVRQEARRRAQRRHSFVSAGIAGAAGLLMALVGLHVLIAENQFKLDNLQQQTNLQQENYEKLRLSVAQLEAPSRIVSVAEGKLGMQQPGSVTYLPATSTPSGAEAGGAGEDQSGAPSAAGSGPTVPAPSGDADWPFVKQFLSGSP